MRLALSPAATSLAVLVPPKGREISLITPTTILNASVRIKGT